jgi:RNA polymerase sigma-70 factor (ECF subfamily)
MPEPQDDDDPAELLARQEERQGLWGLARRRLPEAQFQALWLRYAEDLSVAGIAQVLHKTQTHVKVLLFRARRVLARELKAGHASGLRTGSMLMQSAVDLSGALVSPEPCVARKGPL